MVVVVLLTVLLLLQMIRWHRRKRSLEQVR
jgi:hypothetical protein